MKNVCPHCSCLYYSVDDEISNIADVASMQHGLIDLGTGTGESLRLRKDTCPSCGGIALDLTATMDSGCGWADPVYPSRSIYPIPRVPDEVPRDFAQDYLEAWHILGDSPRASAALSRLLLERILVEESGVPDLAGNRLQHIVAQVVKSNSLPTSISGLLDAPRLLGNAAVHTKRSSTGTVVDVDPQDARFCLEIIGSLLEHYSVTTPGNQRRLQNLVDNLNR